MKFSLLTLIALTTFAGLACAALAKPSVDWLSLVVTAFCGALAAQLLRVLLLEGPRRAAAGGWLLFAIAYVALVFGPWADRQLGPSLATSQAIVYAQERWLPEGQRINVNDLFVDFGTVGTQYPNPLTSISMNPNTSYNTVYSLLAAVDWTDRSLSRGGLFQLTAHWLCGCLAGWLGAAIAAAFYRRQARHSGANS